MKTSIRFTLVAACAVALTACGGGEKIGDKKAAAGVLLALSSGSGQGGGVLNTLAAAAVPAMEQTADCPEGGKATAKIDMSFSGFDEDPSGVDAANGMSQKFSVKAEFDNCGIQFDNPETEEVEKDTLKLDGSQEMKMEQVFSDESMAMLVEMKSKLTLDGVYSDSFDSDVKMNMVLGGTDESFSFKQTIDGFVNTQDEKFNFENETFEFSADAASGLKASKNGETIDLGDMNGPQENTNDFPSEDDFGGDFGDDGFGD